MSRDPSKTLRGLRTELHPSLLRSTSDENEKKCGQERPFGMWFVTLVVLDIRKEEQRG